MVRLLRQQQEFIRVRVRYFGLTAWNALLLCTARSRSMMQHTASIDFADGTPTVADMSFMATTAIRLFLQQQLSFAVIKRLVHSLSVRDECFIESRRKFGRHLVQYLNHTMYSHHVRHSRVTKRFGHLFRITRRHKHQFQAASFLFVASSLDGILDFVCRQILSASKLVLHFQCRRVRSMARYMHNLCAAQNAPNQRVLGEHSKEDL
mmetsp:Transcript_66639/g.105902  ORF Transcript_66639/g.105902 Transcript_66639/m.105902 type:complete len:207 (+) Transcript_66639:1921-2541(+)